MVNIGKWRGLYELKKCTKINTKSSCIKYTCVILWWQENRESRKSLVDIDVRYWWTNEPEDVVPEMKGGGHSRCLILKIKYSTGWWKKNTLEVVVEKTTEKFGKVETSRITVNTREKVYDGISTKVVDWNSRMKMLVKKETYGKSVWIEIAGIIIFWFLMM